jgi:hypothetical protein
MESRRTARSCGLILRTGLAVLGGWLLHTASSPCLGQGPAVPKGAEAAAPQAALPKALSWLKPGALITYWEGPDSIEGTRETIYVRDPQGPFYDDQGNRYRIDSDRRGAGGTTGESVGGHGYVHVHVVGVTDKHALIQTRSYVMDDVNVPPVRSGEAGARSISRRAEVSGSIPRTSPPSPDLE